MGYVSAVGFGILNQKLHFGHIAVALIVVVLNLGGCIIGLLVYAWIIERFYPAEKS